MIIVSVYKKRTTDVQVQTSYRFAKDQLTMTVGLATLFGLGWGFGLAASSMPIEELTFAFQLLFNIFVGSQGALLFFFHCIRNPNVRKQWRMWFTKAGSVPSELLRRQKSRSTITTIQTSSSSHNITSIDDARENFGLEVHINSHSKHGVYNLKALQAFSPTDTSM